MSEKKGSIKNKPFKARKGHVKPKIVPKGKGNDGKKVDRKKMKNHGELLDQLKQLWNSVRDRATNSQVRIDVVARMGKMLVGAVGALALKHDASRVIQFVLQNGKKDIQESIIDEIIPNAPLLSTSPYGHFTMLKLLNLMNDPKVQLGVTKAMKGKFAKVATNTHGARVVEAMFQIFPSEHVATLKLELYAYKSQQLLLDNAPVSYEAFLQDCSELRRKAAMEGIHALVSKLVKKENLFDFSYVQDILFEFASVAAKEGIDNPTLREIIDAVAPAVRRVITTKSGAKLGCLVAACATAKDRKKMLKALKGYALDCLCHSSGYLLILKLVDVTDDTVTLQKMVLDELVHGKPGTTQQFTATGEAIPNTSGSSGLLTMAQHKTGSRLLFLLLDDEASQLPDESEVLAMPSVTSKKDPALRRREHQQFLATGLISVAQDNLDVLAGSEVGADVLAAVCRVYTPPDLLSAVLTQILDGVQMAADSWALQTKSKSDKKEKASPAFMRLSREISRVLTSEAVNANKDFMMGASKAVTARAKAMTSWVDSNSACHVLSSLLDVSFLRKHVIKGLKAKATAAALKHRAAKSKVAAALLELI